MTFAKTIKKLVSHYLPGYHYYTTSSGSGPVVSFLKPLGKKYKPLESWVRFIKALGGSDWMRVESGISYWALGKNGQRFSNLVHYREITTSENGGDWFSFETSKKAIEEWFEKNHEALTEAMEKGIQMIIKDYSKISAFHDNC